MVVTSAPTTSLAPYWLNRVERRAFALDVVKHAFDDAGDIRLDLRHAARGKRRHQQPAKPGVPLASIWVMNSMPMNLSYCS